MAKMGCNMLLALAILAQMAPSSAFAPGAFAGLSAGRSMRLRTSACSAFRMQDDEAAPTGTPEPIRTPPRSNKPKSFWSRNLSDDALSKPRYFDVEDKGEFLAGPDRSEMWGEEMSPIAKWQRTMGPIYVQGGGFGILLLGFANYFALGNSNGLSSPLWTLSIFVALLGFALQRKTD